MTDWLKGFLIRLVTDYVLKYIKARLSEASTWRNMILFCGGIFAIQYGDSMDSWISYIIMAAGFLGTVLPDVLFGMRPTEGSVDASTERQTSDVPFSSGWGDK
jgi:hypothetical protein